MRWQVRALTVVLASLSLGSAMLSCRERPERDQEKVTVPGEGPTYLADSSDSARQIRRDTLSDTLGDTIRDP